MKRNAWLLIYIFIAIHMSLQLNTFFLEIFRIILIFTFPTTDTIPTETLLCFFATPAPGIYTYAIPELISLLQFMLTEIFPVFEKFV